MMRERFRFLSMRAARWAAVAVLALALATVAPPGSAQRQSGTNLLANPGFETNSSRLLADGWTAWPGSGSTAPDYRSSTTALTGNLAQRVQSRAAQIHDGGFYQQVSAGIAAGDAVTFSLWHNWPDDPEDGSQSVRVWLGIDPQGGTDPTAAGVAWTADGRYASDAYQQLLLTTTALSTTVTVFARSKSQYPLPAFVLWDDAALTAAPWQYIYLPLAARNAVAACSLQNGGFEGTYALYDPVHYSNKLVAPHWTPTWRHVPGTLADPEYNSSVLPDPVHSGQKAQQYGTFRRFYQAGLYQQMTGCTVGDVLRFAAWGWGYATDQEVSFSDPDGDMRMRVGLDPTGGTVFTSTTVIWSATANPLDIWAQMSITATVAAPTITVFVLSEPAQAWLHNTSYWDDASLERLP